MSDFRGNGAGPAGGPPGPLAPSGAGGSPPPLPTGGPPPGGMPLTMPRPVASAGAPMGAGLTTGAPVGGQLAAALAGAGPLQAPPGMVPPGMVPNPQFAQWRQAASLWMAETQRRRAQFRSACELIRRDSATGYKINIEADSTIAADEQAEKAARTEFLQSIMPMLQMLIPQMQQMPAAAPLMQALVMFGVRAFPAARSLEDSFDHAFKVLMTAPPIPPPPKGNVKTPAEIAAEGKIAQGEQQVDMAKVQTDQQKNAIELAKVQAGTQTDQAKMAQEAQFKQAELSQQAAMNADRQALQRARLARMLSSATTGMV